MNSMKYPKTQENLVQDLVEIRFEVFYNLFRSWLQNFSEQMQGFPDDVTVLLLKLHVTFAVEIWLAEKADHVVGHYRKEKKLNNH